MQGNPLTSLALEALSDLKANNVTTIDVREITTITDTMIVCSGRSNRHVISIAQNVVTAAKNMQHSFIRMEGAREGEWVIVDLGDVVVHVMIPSAREFYKLEDLWEPITLQRRLSETSGNA